MNIVRCQVNELPNQTDGIMLVTDMLRPQPFGPAPRPGVDTVVFTTNVAKGQGLSFVKNVLSKQLGLTSVDIYRVDARNQSSRETIQLRRATPKKQARKMASAKR